MEAQINKSQIELLEMNTTTLEMNNALDGVIGRLKTIEEKIK